MKANLINEIRELEKSSIRLEPDGETRRNWREATNTYLDEFLDSIYWTRAYVSDMQGLDQFQSQQIGEAEDIHTIIEFIKSSIDNVGLNPASGGHLGYIPGGGVFGSSLGDTIAAITNRYAGLFFGGPGAVRLENLLIEWTRKLIAYPKESFGNITSGGSIANLIAITTARDKMDISPDKIERACIYVSPQTHHCVHKAIRISGLSRSNLRIIDLDDCYRMSAEHLERQIRDDIRNGFIPFYVAASLGSTDTGAIDPLSEIARIAKKYKVWFHIDAAYGGYFILVDELRHLFKGVEDSDSIVLDPHKSLFLPYGTGIVLIKDGKAMYDSHHYMANYLQDAYDGRQDVSPADLSPELTKHFRGLRMWLPIKLHGIEAFRSGLKEKHLLTKYFYLEIKKMGFELGPEPELSVCIYRYIPPKGDANAFNEALVKAVQRDGRVFVSSTRLNDVFWIRIAILSFRTHLQTIDLYLNILGKEIERLLNTKPFRSQSG